MTAGTPSGSAEGPRRIAVGEWAGLVCAAAVGLGLLLARLPPELRKPVLLPLFTGVLVGALAGELARRLRLSRLNAVGPISALGVVLTLALATYDSHRQLTAYAVAHPPQASPDLLGLDAAFQEWLDQPVRADEPPSPDRSQLAAQLAIRREHEAQQQLAWQRRQTLTGYLQFRIPLAWGRWPPALAWLFWIAEAGLAATLGAFTARWMVHDPLASPGMEPAPAHSHGSTHGPPPAGDSGSSVLRSPGSIDPGPADPETLRAALAPAGEAVGRPTGDASPHRRT